jgi:hypothetical protein
MAHSVLQLPSEIHYPKMCHSAAKNEINTLCGIKHDKFKKLSAPRDSKTDQRTATILSQTKFPFHKNY